MALLSKCIFDWHFSQSGGEDFSKWEVGSMRGDAKIVSLLEHLPAGEGDVHYVEALLSDGVKVRTYNVNQVTEPLQEIKPDEIPF